MYFEGTQVNVNPFYIRLNNVVAIFDLSRGKSLSTLRADSEGSSFAFDIAIRVSNPSYKEYKLLYLFDDIEHRSPVFRCLAKEIVVSYERTLLQ